MVTAALQQQGSGAVGLLMARPFKKKNLYPGPNTFNRPGNGKCFLAFCKYLVLCSIFYSCG